MNGKSKSGFRPQQKLIAAMLSVLLSANSAAAGNDLVEGLIGGVIGAAIANSANQNNARRTNSTRPKISAGL